MDFFEEIRMAEIISASLIGVISDEQRKILDLWLNDNAENRILFEQIKSRLSTSLEVENNAEIVENAIRNIHAQIIGRKAVNMPSKTFKFSILKYAAAACLLVAITVTAFFFTSRQNEIPKMPEAAIVASSKVKLITPDGKEVSLGLDTEKVKAGSGSIMRSANGLILMVDRQKSAADTVLHSIVTGLGGETLFVLSDNSKVWLNANSRLDFPVQFANNERKVILKGEAYFEISPDKTRPFIVEAGDLQIKELGTSFNVKAYSEEPTVQTTLLTGKVAISISNRTDELNPGLTAVFEKKNRSMKIKKADLEEVLAWKNGYFIFHDEDLQTVVRTLQRWYDVEFVIINASGELHTFNGRISKYLPLKEILDRITLTGGPKFRMEGKKVYLE
ncbi:MAG: FecR domain-containing protein [Dysgonamonadaceae bacterium]|jgi:mannose-6-phosphate isomerase-like protein (cupin superfamily)|nr:FecR domain-containing protein [Dysgonamonadaceae bacterium]